MEETVRMSMVLLKFPPRLTSLAKAEILMNGAINWLSVGKRPIRLFCICLNSAFRISAKTAHMQRYVPETVRV